MANRYFTPFRSDDGDEIRRAAVEAAAALGSCGWWDRERVAAATAAAEGIDSNSSSTSSLLSLASLLDSAAEYMEQLPPHEDSIPGCIYLGDAGVAYALIRKAERLMVAAEAKRRCIQTASGGEAAPSSIPAAEATAAAAEAAAASKTAEEALNEALAILSSSHERECGGSAAAAEAAAAAAAAERSLRRRFTFLQGYVGRLALTAVALHLLNREREAFSVLRRLAAAAAAGLPRMQPEECELLYGRAGLLYALLFTRCLWLPPPPSGCSSFFSLLAARQTQSTSAAAGLFSDCSNQDTSSSSSRSSSSSGRRAQTEEMYLQRATTLSLEGSSASFRWPMSLNYGNSKSFSSSSSSGGSSSRFDSSSSFSRSSSSSGSRCGCCSGACMCGERGATRVLLLALIAQLVGQLTAQGRATAVANEGSSSMQPLELEEHERLLPSSAAAAFSKAEPLPLLYEWHDKQYLGAAHGVCGVLLQLLHAVDTLYHAAAAGCFPGPSNRAAAPAASATETASGAGTSTEEAASREEAEAAAARLLTCSASFCRGMQPTRGSEEVPVFCAAATAFLCCKDGLAAAAALRDSVRRLCLSSLVALLRFHLTNSANLQSSIGSSRDLLVQWCHGAPGLLPLLCWAVDIHRDKVCLLRAQQQQQREQQQQEGAGGRSSWASSAAPLRAQQQQQQQQQQQECVPQLYRRRWSSAAEDTSLRLEDLNHFIEWVEALGETVFTRGLLRKGLGLCHGIGGNGLSLLCCFSSTKSPRWLRRALLFALEGIRRHQQLLRTPDRPFSLFEGTAGFAVFLRDCAEALRATSAASAAAVAAANPADVGAAAAAADYPLPTTYYFVGYQLPPLPWERGYC